MAFPIVALKAIETSPPLHPPALDVFVQWAMKHHRATFGLLFLQSFDCTDIRGRNVPFYTWHYNTNEMDHVVSRIQIYATMTLKCLYHKVYAYTII